MATLPGSETVPLKIDRDDLETFAPVLEARYTDEGAIKLVEGDVARAQAYLDQKQWNLHWRESDVLYQSPRTNAQFEGSTVARANISRFTVASYTNSLVPGMKAGIFYEKPPFVIRPRPGQSQQTIRAKSALYDALLDEIDFESECERALEYMTTFGTVIVHGGWVTETEIDRKYIRKNPLQMVNLPLAAKPTPVYTRESDEFDIEEPEVTTNRPFFEVCELGEVLVDPGWRAPNQLHKAKYVVRRTYPTFRDLDTLRENGDYDIPSTEALVAYFFDHESDANPPSNVESQQSESTAVHHAEKRNRITTEDVLDWPLECLERWSKKHVYTVLRDTAGRAVVIRNKRHTFPCVPFFSANFWNIPNAGYGLGTGRLSGSDQRVEKGLVDALLDLLSFACNPQYARDRGANAPTQQIRSRLGGIVDVDVAPNKSVRDAFGIIETPQVPPQVFAALQESRNTSQNVVGADEAFTQGSLPQRGGSSAARTATGAGGIIQANANKIQGPVGHFVKGILIPYLYLLDDMVKQQMPPNEIRDILGDELGKAFQLDMDDLLNANHKFEVLAGVHLAAKKAMAQALPLMIQILENPHLVQQLNATGYTVDVKQIFEMFMEMSEWKNTRELIRPMSPRETQMFAQMNPGIQKTKAQLASIGAKHQAKSEEIDQQGDVNLAHDLMLNAGEEAAAWNERKEMRDFEGQGVFSAGT
jgi:hypothetical protein